MNLVPQIRKVLIDMKKVLLLGNSEINIYNFLLELIKRSLDDGYKVIISYPNKSIKPGKKSET